MSTFRCVVATLAGLVLGVIPLCAQSPTATQRYDGVYVGFGYAGAIYDLECTGCVTSSADPDPWEGGHGSGAHVRLGTAVSPRMTFGIEAGGQGTGETRVRSSMIFHLLVTGQYYPAALHRFHLTGGMGAASIMLGMRGGSVEALGLLTRAGVGYDFGIGRSFTVTPYASIGHIGIGQDTIRAFGSAAGRVSRLENRTMVQYGLAINWHP